MVGIDSSQIQVDRATALAHDRGLRNVSFEMGNVYQLGFPDASFDVVFTQALLIHLGDRLAALREIRRVLRHGGIVGISDNDWGVTCWEPSTALLRDAQALWVRVVQHLGGDPYYARHHRRLLLDAGFTHTEGHITAGSGGAFGTLEDTRLLAAALREQFREPLPGLVSSNCRPRPCPRLSPGRRTMPRPPISLRYAEHGVGGAGPVVLLHGFPLNRAMWDEVVPALADRYHVIVPDLRGHGETDGPEGPYDMVEFADDVIALLD